jgi:hypothetical protein
MLNVLIFGDSQTGRTGKAVETLLKAKGAKVKRVVRSGKSTSKLVTIAAGLPPVWDEVYLFSGGNDGSVQANSLRKLLGYFGGSSKVIYAGLPPATVITNVPLAKKVWGSATPKKFFPQTAAKREQKNAAYRQVAAEFPNVVVRDFREAPVSGAVTQPSGVLYPSQPDGIHTTGTTANEVAAYLVSATSTKKVSLAVLVAAAAAAATVVWWFTKGRRGR